MSTLFLDTGHSIVKVTVPVKGHGELELQLELFLKVEGGNTSTISCGDSLDE
jgi:hypothetical protein